MNDFHPVFGQGIWHQSSWEAIRTLPEITVALPLLNQKGFLPIQHHIVDELTQIISTLADQVAASRGTLGEDPTRWSPEGDELVEYLSSILSPRTVLIPALAAVWVAKKQNISANKRQDFWLALKLRISSAYASFPAAGTVDYSRFLSALLQNPLLLVDDVHESLAQAAEILQLPLTEEHLANLETSLEPIIAYAKKRKKDPNANALLSIIGDRNPQKAIWEDGGILLPFASMLVTRSLRKRVAPVLHSVKAARSLAVCWHLLAQYLRRWEVITAFLRRLTVVSEWGYGAPIQSGIVCVSYSDDLDVDKVTQQIPYKHMLVRDCSIVMIFEPQSNIVPIAWNLFSRLQQLASEAKNGVAVGLGEVDYGTLLSAQGIETRRLSMGDGVFVTPEVHNTFFKRAPGVEGIISFTNDSFYTTRKDNTLQVSRILTSELKSFLVKKKKESANTSQSSTNSVAQISHNVASLGLEIDVDEDDPIEL